MRRAALFALPLFALPLFALLVLWIGARALDRAQGRTEAPLALVEPEEAIDLADVPPGRYALRRRTMDPDGWKTLSELVVTPGSHEVVEIP